MAHLNLCLKLNRDQTDVLVPLVQPLVSRLNCSHSHKECHKYHNSLLALARTQQSKTLENKDNKSGNWFELKQIFGLCWVFCHQNTSEHNTVSAITKWQLELQIIWEENNKLINKQHDTNI